MKKIKKLIDEAGKIAELAKLATETKDGHHTPNVTANNIQQKPTTGASPHVNKPTTSDTPGKVTGRDENREQLKKMLRDTENYDNGTCFSVICIHGIPGSGKTTLAQYVCESEKNATHFGLVMWIHVTQNFVVDTIYREMVEAASGEPCPPYKSLDALQNKLKDELHEKLFLLVLDDVWYHEDGNKDQELQQVLSPLKVGKRGSKILVTSRRALSYLGLVKCTLFPIPEMDSEDFYQLFMHYALGGTTVDDKDARKNIGKEIAKKLKGSPLAATIVGRRLLHYKDLNYWIEFNGREHLDDVMDFLWWSFLQFDEEVRRCFAYCSIFPRRYRLERDELVRLWATQGFINTTNGDDKEVAAQRYLDDLLSALFLRPLYNDYPEDFFYYA